jgi:hypothetical protein
MVEINIILTKPNFCIIFQDSLLVLLGKKKRKKKQQERWKITTAKRKGKHFLLRIHNPCLEKNTKCYIASFEFSLIHNDSEARKVPGSEIAPILASWGALHFLQSLSEHN